jgi:pyrroline-5-carboxylate reductase
MRNWRSAATIFMPTLISMIDGGITLTCHNNHVDEDKKKFFERSMSFEETITRVSTKGGITYEGVKVFKEMLPQVFDKALDVSMKRYEEIKKQPPKVPETYRTIRAIIIPGHSQYSSTCL